jgi:hypothetical protein
MSQSQSTVSKANKPKYVKVVKDSSSTNETKADSVAKAEVVAKAEMVAKAEVVAKADSVAKAEKVAKKVKVYGTYINIPAKFASFIIGVKASGIKGIEKEVGNNTRLYYETEKEAVSITSSDKQSLKAASLKILSLLDEAKKKEAAKKPIKEIKSFNIHPDILKADLVYQIIGPKGSYIQEIIAKVGRGCNIKCNKDGKYVVEVESKTGLNIAYDLLMKRERIILTNPENKDTIDRSRGYRLIKVGKGKYNMEYIGQDYSLIDIYKKKESVRYWLSKNKNIPLYDVKEEDIEEEYNNFYNYYETKEEPKKVDIEQLIEEMKSMPIVIPVKEMKTIWNDKEKVNTIKDDLPEIAGKLNILHYKLKKERLSSVEDSLVVLDLSYIMDENYDDEEDEEDTNELLPYLEYEKEEESDNLPEFVYNVEGKEEVEYLEYEEYDEEEYDEEESNEPVYRDAWD